MIVDSNYIKDSQKHQMFATTSKADQQTMDLFVNHNYKSGQVSIFQICYKLLEG